MVHLENNLESLGTEINIVLSQALISYCYFSLLVSPLLGGENVTRCHLPGPVSGTVQCHEKAETESLFFVNLSHFTVSEAGLSPSLKQSIKHTFWSELWSSGLTADPSTAAEMRSG